VPAGTIFQALPCQSTVDDPAQEVPGPAAQSFLPASDTPKHFSMPPDWACAVVVIMAAAAATEAAMPSAVVFIWFSRFKGGLLAHPVWRYGGLWAGVTALTQP